MEKNNLKGWLYLIPAFLFLGIFMIYPLVDVFVYSFGKIFFFAGSGKSHLYIEFIAKAAKLVGHFCKCVIVAAADFKGGVNKDVAYVIVACNKAGKEAIKRVKVRNVIFVNVNKANLVRKVKAKGVAAFDCYHAAAGGFYRFFNAVDKEFGFAGAFKAKYKFDHFYVSLCSLLSLRERSLTEVG